ncbi:MAG: AcrB/AcrD/AcrF family protein [Helicobacteraceae bacterium]|nr:AcrB/AcrD/AcrF family protein [Helicobacteraceae bacterium]
MSAHKTNLLEKLIHSLLESSFKKMLVYLITFLIFAGSVYMIPTELVKAKMLPGKDSNTFSLYVDLPKDSSVAQIKEVTTCISKLLMKEQDILTSSVFLGEGQPLDFAGMVKGSAMKNGENVAEMMINIKTSEHRVERSYNMIHRLRPIIQDNCSLYGANIKFIELPSGPPVLASVVAEVYGGNSFENRKAFAEKIADVFKAQPTLVDIDVLADKKRNKYRLVLDNNRLLESGVGIEQLKKMMYMAFEGHQIGTINSDNAENQIGIFVRLDDTRILNDDSKKAIEAKLKTLKVVNEMGIKIPMSRFISVKQSAQSPSLTSKNLQSVINVIAETDMESQIYPLLDSRTQMKKDFADQYEVTNADMLNLAFKDKTTGELFEVKFDGELKVTIDTFIDLGIAFIGALVLIYFLMVIYYKRFAIAGAILVASFLSIVGVIVGHYVMDLYTADTFYLTATSLIGFIGLIGINSRNSLLIIDFAVQLMNEKGLDANRAIAVATATRAKPILLTVLAIVFASSLLASDAVFGGLGVALIGGTLFAYLVSLFFVPLAIQNALKKIELEKE